MSDTEQKIRYERLGDMVKQAVHMLRQCVALGLNSPRPESGIQPDQPEARDHIEIHVSPDLRDALVRASVGGGDPGASDLCLITGKMQILGIEIIPDMETKT